jgi:hypothetical protein
MNSECAAADSAATSLHARGPNSTSLMWWTVFLARRVREVADWQMDLEAMTSTICENEESKEGILPSRRNSIRQSWDRRGRGVNRRVILGWRLF